MADPTPAAGAAPAATPHAPPTPNAPPDPPGDRALSRATQRALRRVLHAHHDGGAADAPLAAAARLLVDDAHRSGHSVVHMLVAFKAAWWALADVRAAETRDPAGARAVLDRFVSLAIAEYYGGGDGAAAGPPAVR